MKALNQLKSTWQQPLNDFVLYLRSERSLSPHTIDAYQTDLANFFFWLADNKFKDYQSVTREQLIGWLQQMQIRGYSSASRARALAAIKLFFHFFKREGYYQGKIAEGISSPTIESKLPSVLSKDEVERLLEAPNQKTTQGLLERAILVTLYSCGLRVSELCHLKIEDVYDDFIRVFGKGRKQRQVPIGKKAIEAIDKYLATREDQQPELFINDKMKPINRFYVFELVKSCAQKAAIAKEVSPHTLRHTFATHLLDEEVDIYIVQELLGHAKIDTTQRYTHLSKKRLKEAFERYHPRLH